MKKAHKITWNKHTIEVTKEDGKYTLWMHNKSIDENLSIVMAHEEYFDLLALLDQAK